MTLSLLDKQALFAQTEHIDEICLDLQERIGYFCRQKHFAPLEYLLGCLKFAACGVVSFDEGERADEFVEIFRYCIETAQKSQEEDHGGPIKAYWPDGTEVT